jgi:hypothetical protein
MRVARRVWVGLVFRVKELTRSGLFVFTSVIEPLIFATLTYYLFGSGSKPDVRIGAGPSTPAGCSSGSPPSSSSPGPPS